MKYIYNAVLNIAEAFVIFIVKIHKLLPDNKLRKFALGRYRLVDRIEKDFGASEGNSGNASCSGRERCRDEKPLYWIHAASLGEYGVARPLIRRLKRDDACRIVLTFFSPTGYEVLKNNREGIDFLYYLPLDTPDNARRFIDAVRPDRAVFIISEYWLNYLAVLKERHIPVFLVSAIIRDNSPFFKWYGSMFRNALGAYTRFMVLNSASENNLNRLGYNNVTVTGDPLFDNVAAVASRPFSNTVIEHFVNGADVFIAGSVSDRKDVSMVADLAAEYTEQKFIIVPHEIEKDYIGHIRSSMAGKSLLYSECDADTDFSGVRFLIVDCMGLLAYIYRYARWAYVGGGFTPYLHNVMEAAVYGLPVAFGPRIERKTAPQELMALGLGAMVSSGRELMEWFSGLKDNPAEMSRIKEGAKGFVDRNSGVTDSIVRILQTDGTEVSI